MPVSNACALDAQLVRAQILFHLSACLNEWKQAVSHGTFDHPSIPSLIDYSNQVIPQLSAAGFTGIAQHLAELVRCVDARGTLGDPRDPLKALLEVTERARQSLGTDRCGSGTRESPEALSAHSGARAAQGRPSVNLPRSDAQRGVGATSTPAEMGKSLLGLRAFRARALDGERGDADARAALRQPPFVRGRDRSRGGSDGDDPGTTSADVQARAPAHNVKELLGIIDRNRGNRVRGGFKELAAARRQRRWITWVSLGLSGLGIAGLVVAVATWRQAGSPQIRTVASAVTPLVPSATPHTPLLTEDETFSSLLTLVHGRGKESTELQALVNEQAALVARSRKTCEGSPAECAQLAKLREGVLGTAGVQRIAKRRPIPGAVGRVPPRWLIGLELPDIPIEDDPRVQRSLEYYAERPVGRELFQGMLFRCGAYREAIESTLVRYGLPKGVFAVVFAESGCEPEAVSPVGAAGLWQLMPDTARAYGLRVNKEVVDERRNAPKSTEAAVRFLRDLRDKMAAYYPNGVWDLVFGSYNMGPFAMAARVEHAGGDVGFWDLVDAQRLPDETVHYTPTVQALALILRNLQRFKFAGVQMRAPQLTADLEVQPGTRLSLIARAASTSLERIRAINLDIMSDRTPAITNFAVQVPKEVVWQARESLAELTAAHDESDLCVPAGFDWGRKHFTKEMAEACKRKLKTKQAGIAAPNGPASSG